MDLNPVGASDIAKDKDYANFFMKKMGYPIVPGRTFFSRIGAALSVRVVTSMLHIDTRRGLGFPFS